MCGIALIRCVSVRLHGDFYRHSKTVSKISCGSCLPEALRCIFEQLIKLTINDVYSLSKYEAAIKSFIPSTDIDTPIKIFRKSIELYSIIFHKRIEIILDYYMSTMDLDNDNNQYFGSYEISFSPMIFIEQKLYMLVSISVGPFDPT